MGKFRPRVMLVGRAGSIRTRQDLRHSSRRPASLPKRFRAKHQGPAAQSKGVRHGTSMWGRGSRTRGRKNDM